MTFMLATMTPAAATAEPQVLADSDLDAVTAAGVLINVSSVASAVGDHTVAGTRAQTSIRGGPLIEVGLGLSDGYASACCSDDSDVVLGSTAVGAGDLVYGKTYTVKFRGATYTADGGFGHFAYGYTGAFLLAISFEDGFEMVRQAVQESQADVHDLTTSVRELTSELREGFATGFELGPAVAVGMRWQAAQDLAAGYANMRRLADQTRPGQVR